MVMMKHYFTMPGSLIKKWEKSENNDNDDDFDHNAHDDDGEATWI